MVLANLITIYATSLVIGTQNIFNREKVGRLLHKIVKIFKICDNLVWVILECFILFGYAYHTCIKFHGEEIFMDFMVYPLIPENLYTMKIIT